MRTYEVPVHVSSNMYDCVTFKSCEEAYMFSKLIGSEVWECVKDGKNSWSYYVIEEAWIPRRIAIEQMTERMAALDKSQRTQEIVTWVKATNEYVKEMQQ